MNGSTRMTGLAAAAVAALVVAGSPASAAAPTKFTFSSTGVSADAVFTNAPADEPLVPGQVYTDVFVYAAEQASKSDGTRYSEDFAFIDAYSYKIDDGGEYIPVSSSFGFAGNDDVDFTGDRRLTSAALTARVQMQTCDEQDGCTDGGVADIALTWTGSGATTKYKSSYRTSDPGQFTSSGRFTGTSRQASATGTVPVMGHAGSVYGSISSGTYTDRTICHAC